MSRTIDARGLQDGLELVGAVDVPVVVAEHGQDGHADVAHGVGDDLRLLGLAVRGEVAGEQDHVHAVLQRGEGRVRPLLVVGALAVVHVTRGGDPDPAFVPPLGRAARRW